MSSVRFAPTSSSTADKKPHFRFPSSNISNNLVTSELLYQDPLAVIPRPKSTQPHSQHTRYQTLSHDITPRGNGQHLHPHHPHHHHHHALQPVKDKPRPSSISKIPSQQLQSLMKPSSVSTTTTPAVRPRTQSLTDSSLNIPSLPPSSALQRTSWLVPHHHQSRTPSPSPSSASRHSIGSIKKSLIETIDAYSCSLEDKLTLVAKLHAEVEAELTHLNHRASSASTHTYNHSSQRTPMHDYHGAHARKEVEDTIRLIKHADRIKAHAIQQLKHDISHSHSSLHSSLHPTLPQSHHHPQHLPPHSSSKLALLSRELH
ncbi:hypothetical protein PCASD_19280 [Puccinia coronata f. sp. avenae]|uniref:Uncharacterized protein n=1 Tax=Puccinia coronata f. sp. avenae TaxID=200324 RepID=A0A2N5SRY6_9BASI|nr:hypothetical protein PCASD_19280 [Puccinia coronata f. sp. avenae]